MFIQIVHKDNMNHPIAWLNAFDSATTSKKIDGDRILEFITLEDNLKTPYLFDESNYKIIADGQIYSVVDVTSIVQTGEDNKVQVEAEHYSYSLNENTFELFEYEGNIVELMNHSLTGTNFIFSQTDVPLSEVKKLKIPFTNARYLVNRISREFKAKIAYDNNKISLFRSFSNATGIRLTIDKNLHSIKRNVSYKEGVESVTYEIDVIESNLEVLETVDLGDALVVLDKARGNIPVDRVVGEVTKDLIINKVIELVLGDPNPKFSDVNLDLYQFPILEDVQEMIDKIDPTILINVVEEKVIVAETAMIMSCWINELNVEYLETNFAAIDIRQPYPANGRRDFIRIDGVRQDWVTQELSSTEVVDYKTHSGLQIYWTAIAGAQAYRFFTITHPKVYNKDLTDQECEAFKVKVRKVVKEAIKKSILFDEVYSDDGTKVISPVEVNGEGVAIGSERGKERKYKNKNRAMWTLNAQDNDGFGGYAIDAITSEPLYYNPILKKWLPTVNIYNPGDNKEQVGNVIIHPAGSTIDTINPHGSPCLHVVHDGTILKNWGSTRLMRHLSILGEEIAVEKSPIVPLPQPENWAFSDNFNDLLKWEDATNAKCINGTVYGYLDKIKQDLIPNKITSHNCVIKIKGTIYSQDTYNRHSISPLFNFGQTQGETFFPYFSSKGYSTISIAWWSSSTVSSASGKFECTVTCKNGTMKGELKFEDVEVPIKLTWDGVVPLLSFQNARITTSTFGSNTHIDFLGITTSDGTM